MLERVLPIIMLLSVMPGCIDPPGAQPAGDAGRDVADRRDHGDPIDMTADMTGDMTGDIPATPSCQDGMLSPGESDVDCGGDCAPCATGSSCNDPADCIDEICRNQVCEIPRSCADLARIDPEAATGVHTIDPDGAGPFDPLDVHCDMESDGGVGYTMLRVEDPSLASNNDASAYVAACEALGLELAVPRSRGHALALLGHLGGPPNLIGVYPSQDNAVGLDNFEGRCQGSPCRFYVSDAVNNSSNCSSDAPQPDGTNDVDSPLYLWNPPTDDCPIGRFDDAANLVTETGYVACSTNDVGPPTYGSCLQILDANSVQNTSLYGINGLYTVEPEGSSQAVDIYCDFIRDGGGYGYLKIEVAGEFDTSEAEAHCAQFGMRLLIPRSRVHRLNASAVGREGDIGPSGNIDYLEILGVYPAVDGAACAAQPLRSDNANCEWVAGDGGTFFVHEVNGFAEPDGSDSSINDSLEYGWDSNGELLTIEERSAGSADSQRFICIVGDKPGP